MKTQSSLDPGLSRHHLKTGYPMAQTVPGVLHLCIAFLSDPLRTVWYVVQVVRKALSFKWDEASEVEPTHMEMSWRELLKILCVLCIYLCKLLTFITCLHAPDLHTFLGTLYHCEPNKYPCSGMRNNLIRTLSCFCILHGYSLTTAL